MQTNDLAYADFQEAYTQVNLVTKELYSSAKKFVETVEPQINQCVKKLSVFKSGPPHSYEAVFSYMSHFDEFTLSANKFFNEAKKVLEQSENCMQRITSVTTDTSEIKPEDTDLNKEITNLFHQLKSFPVRTQDLQKEMDKLENNWKRTRAKAHL
jgi:chromosome segregation ATPase